MLFSVINGRVLVLIYFKSFHLISALETCEISLLSLWLPARRRPQGVVVIGVCLSVCLSVRTVFVRKISQERVHGSPPNLVGGAGGKPLEQVQFWC